jgi:hypothetical protein
LTAQAAGLGEAAARESARRQAPPSSVATRVPAFATASARRVWELAAWGHGVWASSAETGGILWGVGDSLPFRIAPLLGKLPGWWSDPWGKGGSYSAVLFLSTQPGRRWFLFYLVFGGGCALGRYPGPPAAA